jgi:hypothetical protein
MIVEAFRDLFPERTLKYKPILTYSGQFKDYGANVRLGRGVLEFRLSKKWLGISKEIVMGLLQELMQKLWKSRERTIYIDLYNDFIKNVHIAIPKTIIEPELKESFDRVNKRYFLEQVEMPNLKWGKHSTTYLGSYDFKTDAITISKIFLNKSKFVDLIMFHEMLHKVNKFKKSGSKTFYHDKRFKYAEKQFDDYDLINKELKRFLRFAKFKRIFS